MSPASSKGLHLSFIANLASGKFDDIETHSSVNVAFSDASSSDWISISGKAEIVKDQEVVDELWDPSVRSWFGDLKDGVHDGGKEDPRVGVIRVIPDEIRYWIKTKTSFTQAYEVAKGALTGETAAPGALRIISGADLDLVRKMELGREK